MYCFQSPTGVAEIMLNTLEEKIADIVIRRRGTVIALCLLLVAISSLGLSQLRFDTDYRVWFSKENPQLEAFESIQDTYTKYDNVLFVLAPKQGEIFTKENLEAVRWLTNEAWQIPYSIRAESVANYQHTYASGDELTVTDLIPENESLPPSKVAEIKNIALNEPGLRDLLVSSDAKFAGVNVNVQTPGDRTDLEVPEIVSYARALSQRFEQKYPQIDVYMTGIIMMNHAFPEASQKDVRSLVPMMFIIVILTLLLITRSLVGTIGTLLVMILSVVAAMGLMGWSGTRLTASTASAPIIIITLAVADCVHVLTNFLHGIRLGDTKTKALKSSLRQNLQPIFLTSLTTIIGFLSLNFGDTPPFRHLGNLVAVGVSLAFIFSISFFPAFLSFFPSKNTSTERLDNKAMDRLANWVIYHQRKLIYIIAPVSIIFVAFVARIEFNDEFLKYFDESVEFRRHTEFSTKHLTGIYTLQFSLPSGESSGISMPEYLETVEKFANWFRQQPEVIHVNTITDVLKRLNKNLHGDDEQWHRLPDNRELAAQYLLLYEMSLPYGLDLNGQINVDKSETRLVVTTENLSTAQSLDLENRSREWLITHGLEPMKKIHGSSPNIMFAHIAERNVRGMILGTGIALLLICLILLLVLRSVKIGLISLIPNILPAALSFGIWGLLVGRVGLAVSVVAAISIGIIVDDTVHFLSKYVRARKLERLPPADAIRAAFTTVGTALWVTSAVLIAGFLVLAQSAFEVNSVMGSLTATTIALALFTDFFLLPPLLLMFDRNISTKR